MDITRDKAMSEIMERLEEATDEQIADVLETLVGNEWGANFRIVGSDPAG